MTLQTREHREYHFAIGLLTGAVFGAGLALWLAPRSGSELRKRVGESAKRLGTRASDQFQHLGEAVGELTRTGQDVRDDVADRIARGAREVERFAAAAKSDRS